MHTYMCVYICIQPSIGSKPKAVAPTTPSRLALITWIGTGIQDRYTTCKNDVVFNVVFLNIVYIMYVCIFSSV